MLDLKVKLAKCCPLKDKAFTDSTKGTVLGIVFDSEELSWHLPEEKRIEYMNSIHEMLQSEATTKESVQKLLGRLNFVSMMSPFMRTFKKNLQELLRELEESEQSTLPLSDEAREDLACWWHFLKGSRNGFPIASPSYEPPLQVKTITSDAAGWQTGSKSEQRVGLGCVGIDEEGEIFLARQVLWNLNSMGDMMAEGNKRLGSKTTSLEFAGILIPFLSEPESLSGQHVKIQVDNIGCCFAWENG